SVRTATTWLAAAPAAPGTPRMCVELLRGGAGLRLCRARVRFLAVQIFGECRRPRCLVGSIESPRLSTAAKPARPRRTYSPEADCFRAVFLFRAGPPGSVASRRLEHLRADGVE